MFCLHPTLLLRRKVDKDAANIAHFLKFCNIWQFYFSARALTLVFLQKCHFRPKSAGTSPQRLVSHFRMVVV